MLKEQRARLPEFIANVKAIIESEGIGKVSELLGVTDRTVKQWLKGKENGGTEPPSADYKRHETTIAEYIANVPPEDEAAEESILKNRVLNEITSIVTSCDTYLKMPLSPEERMTVGIIRELCTSTLEMPLTVTSLEVYRLQLDIIQAQYDAFQEGKSGEGMAAETIDIEAEEVIEMPTLESGASASAPGEGNTIRISLDLIDPNPYQPRKTFDEAALEELADSIRANGLLQIPVVRRHGDRYQLIAGERRTRAVRMIGWTEMTVTLAEMTDAQMATAALIENLQRQDVSALETARAVDRLISELGMKQGDVAKQMGVTQAKVSQMLALLRLCDPLLEAVEKGELSQSIGRIVGTLDQEIQQKLVVKELEDMTVKDVQRMTNQIKFVETLFPKEPIEEDDSVKIKFLKFFYERGMIDIFAIWKQNRYTLTKEEGNLEQFKNSLFRTSTWLTFPEGYRQKHQAELDFLCDAVNKSNEGNALNLLLKKDHGGFPEAIKTFMKMYCPYEPPKVTQKPTKGKASDSEPSTPPAPRMTKEEKEQRLQEAQEQSPVPVLTISKGTTKTERLFQRIQEHQREPVNELTQRCYNCKNFNPDGEEYKDRCNAKHWSLNSLDRYFIEGEADLFVCSSYEPTDEQIQKEKVEGLNPEMAMLEMLLYAEYVHDHINRMYPELKGKSNQEILDAYAKMDPKNKAYFVSVLSLRVGMIEVANRKSGNGFLFRPDGTRIATKRGFINGADDI